MKPRFALSLLGVLIGLAAVLLLFTGLFSRWTATSVYSFPRFLLAVPLFIYFPGRCVLDCARVQLLPLEHLSLSLVLGLLSSSLAYWIAMFLGIPALFLPWPIAATAVCAYRAASNWSALIRWRATLDVSHLLLGSLLAVEVGLLAVAPAYYRNLILLPGARLQYFACSDAYLHIAIANELTHSVPPQVPFIAGHPLSYHYASDLPTAFFSVFAGLSTLDLTVRFMPTLVLLMTALAIFTFSRAWLQSGPAGVLVACLVLLGEDFAFIPGLWFHSEQCWSSQYFGVPSTFSLYGLNPMLPALGVLFAGLFCLLKLFRDGGKSWLALTAVLFASVLEYKVFIAGQVLLALGLAALLYLVIFRDRRLFLVLNLTVLFMTVFAFQMWQANAAGAHQTMRFYPTQYLPEFVRQIGLADGHWGKRVIYLFSGRAVTLRGLAACFLAVLPLYLAGSLGARLFGLPRLIKDLVVPKSLSAPRFFLALFVCAGPVLTLTCVVVSQDKRPEWQYNNAVWFLVQSKYLAWIFAVEFICAASWLGRRGLRVAAGFLLIALALPATVQYFCYSAGYIQNPYYKVAVLPGDEAEVMSFLTNQGPPGQVVVFRHEVGLPLATLTRCRSSICSLFCHSDQFVGRSVVSERQQDWQTFWQSWAEGTVRVEILRKYRVVYLVVDKEEGGADSDPGRFEQHYGTGSEKVQLRRCFENVGFVVYCVCLDSFATAEIDARASLLFSAR